MSLGRHLGRRQFLKVAGAATTAAGLGAGARFLRMPEAPSAPESRRVPTFCELCFWKCGVVATVENGVLTRLEGHPEHPLARGRLCPRGNGATGLLYDPDRLKRPLIREGPRGEERFREASWKEALDYVAQKMREIKRTYGPEAMALFTHGHGGSFFAHLLKAYGSPNIAAPSYAQCRGPREVGFQLTFGTGVGSPENTDIANTRMLVLVGSHLGENMHNTQVQEFAEAIRRGARIVVVDPRFSTAASKAHWYLPIKPGTDLALLLAWIHVLIEEELYDRDYVERFGFGFDKLKEITASDTPEWAAAITEIPAETIRAAAREMGRQKPAVLIHPGRHVTWYGDDTQRSRAIAILNALLGSWGRPGGFYLPSGVSVPKPSVPEYPKPARPAADGSGLHYPLADELLASGLCEATITGAPYSAKGWIVYGTNLIQSLPNPAQTIEAINRLELLVVVDVLPVEIAGYADVVLPECTYLERYDDLYAASFREPFLALRQPVVEPMYESRPGWWMARELARRLGLEAYFPWKKIEEYLDGRLRAVNLTLEEMKQRGVVSFAAGELYLQPGHRFDTPTGKIEFYSPLLAELGVDAVPRYRPVAEPPPDHFRLLFGRSPLHTFGRTANNRVLGSLVAENELWINDKVAARLGIRHGDKLRLVNQDGVRSNPVRARPTRRIRPDAVYMVHGFGHTAAGLRFARGRGADDAALVTRYAVDPLMGGTGMFVNFVRLEKEA